MTLWPNLLHILCTACWGNHDSEKDLIKMEQPYLKRYTFVNAIFVKGCLNNKKTFAGIKLLLPKASTVIVIVVDEKKVCLVKLLCK